MKTLYVGGSHFLNRFSSLEAAVARAEDDDIIEICKDLKDVEVKVSKNITINGNGHQIIPASGKCAVMANAYVTLNDIRFECLPRTNAISVVDGGILKNIRTSIKGPVRAIYPTVMQRNATLTIEDCTIMGFESYESHGTKKQTVTFVKRSAITDYYGGAAYLDDDNYYMSKFNGMASIEDSSVSCTLFAGKCRLSGVTLTNFNRVIGTMELTDCMLAPHKMPAVFTDEPADGPLKNWNRRAIPFALHITGAKVMVRNFKSDMDSECIGFYMTSGSLDIQSTNGQNSDARHLIRGGAVVFNNVDDDGFYEIRGGRCGVINSTVNTSADTRSAMEQLDSMIGLQSVKDQLHTVMNTVSVNMVHPERDFGFSNHMIFAGDPGTGKTTVAKLVAAALFEIGAISENKCMEVPASQFIKGFVGQTGEHVENIMKKALGGVLFIDEAYQLTVKDNQNTFNDDAIAVLIRYMEDHRGDLVIIAAGYEKEMREFLASNAGLARRFQWISFENYTPAQMGDIFLSMCRQYKETLGFEQYENELIQMFTAITDFYLRRPDAKGRITNGGNGGLVRNIFQQTVFARNNRIVREPGSSMKFTRDDLRTAFKEELKKAVNITYGYYR